MCLDDLLLQLPRPGAVRLRWGYHWLDDWESVTVRNVTDLEGWVYASSFAEMGQLLNSTRNLIVSAELCCRSRKWLRRMKVLGPSVCLSSLLVSLLTLSIERETSRDSQRFVSRDSI
jgi:hypothetical protein